MVASRWPWRFSPAAVIRRATSPSVRYSRARTSALRLRRGGRRRSSTVPITVVGATSARCGFCHGFSGLSSCDCPKYELSWDTAQGEKRRFYGHNCDFGRGGRTGQHARDAELAGIFCRRAQPTHAQQWPAKGGKWRKILQCHDGGAIAGSRVQPRNFTRDFFWRTLRMSARRCSANERRRRICAPEDGRRCAHVHAQESPSPYTLTQRSLVYLYSLIVVCLCTRAHFYLKTYTPPILTARKTASDRRRCLTVILAFAL